MNDNEFRMIMELAPFFVGTVAIVMVFLYLIARLLIAPKPPKVKKSKKEKHADPEMEEQLEEAVRRAMELERRIGVLEEIIEAERTGTDP